MPRPKVSEEARRRIAKACLHCQATKQKCDGQSPCSSCTRQGHSTNCAYSDHVRSYGHRRQRRHLTAIPKDALTKPPTGSTGESIDAGSSTPDKADGMIEIAVPKLPRSLYDTKGKVVYLGDCSALSFLQNIQELIERETPPSSEGSNWREFEELPPDPDEMSLSYAGNVHDLKQLIQTFFTATCGLLDMIEVDDVNELLSRWIHGSLGQHRGGEAVLYLILAYAAQAQASCPVSHKRAHSFYHHGRRTALLNLTDDPSVETVQAFLLISLYMLGCSRRNGAFLNLGIAISAAKALGFHRQETNLTYPARECQLRARIWATLKYHDLFFCAMMGRTSSTITTDSTVSDEQVPLDPSVLIPDSEQETAMRESALAFSFMERTVNEIYTKRTVSMGALKSMAQELQTTINRIPAELQVDPSSTTTTYPQKTLLRNSNVLCSYYFSMMLLTRPFLVAKLRAYLSPSRPPPDTTPYNPDNALVYNDITTNATSCIEAATETVRLLHGLLSPKVLLSNMPLTVAWTFVSALTICSAYFGQLGSPKSIEATIVQAGQILDHFAISSPQARRYSCILRKLSGAARRNTERYPHNNPPPSEPSFFASMPTASEPGHVPRDFVNLGTEQLGYADDAILAQGWDIGNMDMSLFPLDLGNADSIWDINWVGSLM